MQKKGKTGNGAATQEINFRLSGAWVNAIKLEPNGNTRVCVSVCLYMHAQELDAAEFMPGKIN